MPPFMQIKAYVACCRDKRGRTIRHNCLLHTSARVGNGRGEGGEKKRGKKEKRKRKRGRSSSKQTRLLRKGRAVAGPTTGGATVLQVVTRCKCPCTVLSVVHATGVFTTYLVSLRPASLLLHHVGAAGVNAERRAHVDTEIQFLVNVKHLQ